MLIIYTFLLMKIANHVNNSGLSNVKSKMDVVGNIVTISSEH